MASLAHPDPYTTPALKPPPGQQPDFAHSPSSQNWLVAIGALCLTFALVFISARTFVKTYIIKKTQIEDCVSPKWRASPLMRLCFFGLTLMQTRSYSPGLPSLRS